MGKTAFIFPGQGAQICGMGKEFFEQNKVSREVFELADSILGFSISDICFKENDLLDRTDYTQAALVTTELAVLAAVTAEGHHADITAGLSLGEYAALAASGVMSVSDAILSVRERGILMQEAVPAGIGGMRAILGMENDRVKEVIDQIDDVTIANYNAPGQVVMTGKLEALDEAEKRLREVGARRILPLNVSGPFHSPFLREAGEKLGKYLEKIEVMDPVIPYVANATGKPVTDKNEVKDLLIRQVSSSVLWQQSVEEMIAQGVDTFVEIGTGKTLCSLIKKISKDVTMIQIEKPEDLLKLG